MLHFNCRVNLYARRLLLAKSDNLPVVHHRDHNKHNNHVENLEWVTYRQNIIYAYEAGRARPPYRRETAQNDSAAAEKDVDAWLKDLGY